MNFALSDEQQAIFNMAHAFGQSRIAPHAREWEAAGTIPREVVREAAELGFGGLYVNEEDGGTGLTRLDATLVFEALSMSCPKAWARRVPLLYPHQDHNRPLAVGHQGRGGLLHPPDPLVQSWERARLAPYFIEWTSPRRKSGSPSNPALTGSCG